MTEMEGIKFFEFWNWRCVWKAEERCLACVRKGEFRGFLLRIFG